MRESGTILQQHNSGHGDHAPGDHRYAYKAALIGASREFELTDAGLAWQIGGREGVWPYARIAAVALSYRPASMQSRRFRADIIGRSGERITILSTTWKGFGLMAPQDDSYRAFILALHGRLSREPHDVLLTGGMRPLPYAFGLVLLAVAALAVLGLLVRSVLSGATTGALFVLAFAGLFGWQIAGFMTRNKPRHYMLDAVPRDLLP